MKKLTMLLTTYSLLSCNHNPIEPQELCTVLVRDSGEVECRCREYDLEKLTSLSEAQNFPIEYCNTISGFRAEAIAQEIIPKVKYKIRACEDAMEEAYSY